MPRVGYVYDPVMALHQTSSEQKHPECPDRIHKIYELLLRSNLISRMIPVKTRSATFEELLEAHQKYYLETLEWKLRAKATVRKQLEQQYNSIYTNEDTLLCAKLAAGSTIELTLQVIRDQLDSGVAIVRPPGHHATTDQAMGFCFYNNVALAAKIARRYVDRVLIVDWDVHHGNGTEKIVAGDSSILFISVHRYDQGQFYPQTGHPGTYDNVVNVGFSSSKPMGDQEYLQVFNQQIIPLAQQFNPNLILVSAGFDAAQGDPLGEYEVTPEGYHQMTRLLQQVCPKMVLVLEGGYNLTSISESMTACVKSLLKKTTQ